MIETEAGVNRVARTVVLGVGGGIAAYKAAALCSLLTKRGYDVEVLMTEHATRFIQPLTFQSLSKRPVVVDTFAEPRANEIAHIAIADRADVMLIAPATANLIGKLANGIADDMVSTTALAVTAPVIVAPAMNVHMLAHPAVQMNLETLRNRGVILVDPGSGPLACGYTGKGRLAEPDDIADVVDAVLRRKSDLTGRSIVVTAGPTVEDIDPVRYLSNRSSGKMGYAIASAAVLRGARVTLISGPTHLPPVVGADRVDVRSTEDMLRAVAAAAPQADALISAAAPADFRPVERLAHKWKKSDGTPTIELERTPDILATVAADKRPHQVYVGFAAETQSAVAYGEDKLHRKNLDFVVVNNVLETGAGFGVDTNRVTFLGRGAVREDWPLLTKHEVADRILDAVCAAWQTRP